MNISILHPFTAEAVGLKEKDILKIHSQPHVNALKMLADEKGMTCTMDYFTSKWRYHSEQVNGIEYRFFPVDFKINGDHKKWKKQESAKCLKLYKKNTPDVTIINMSGHSSPFSFKLSNLIRSNNKQYIAMLGGQHYSNIERNRLYYKNAHQILVHTVGQKKEMEKIEMFKDLNIQIFPLGVDTEIFNPSPRRNPSPNLLYVGRVTDWKRVHFAINALKKLLENGFRSSHLSIIGPLSSNSYYHQLLKLIESKDLKGHVTFLGQKEHSELIPYFQQADLFCLPSDKETFGMVMVEAMACATPVAAIDSPGGPREIITHGENGILTSPEKYAEEILNYFTNDNYSREMGRKARIKIEREYSLEATYKALEKSVELASKNNY